MKTLMALTVLSVFSFSAATYACDGMRDHEKSSDTQAKADGKADNAKSPGKAKRGGTKPHPSEDGASRS
jgi:hypothetical protein